MQRIILDTVASPASKFARGVVRSADAERLVFSSQVDLRLDGTMADRDEAQAEQARRNVVAAAGFEREQMLRATMQDTEPGQVAVCRTVRDRVLEGHSCAEIYLDVSGLAAPAWLVEIEVEAVKE